MYKYKKRRVLLVVPVLVCRLWWCSLLRACRGRADGLMAESGNVSPRELQNSQGLGLIVPSKYSLWSGSCDLQPRLLIFNGDAISVSLKVIPVTIELAVLAMAFAADCHPGRGALQPPGKITADYIGRLVAISGLSFPDFGWHLLSPCRYLFN